MVGDFSACDRCGQHVHIDDLDAKPSRFNRWWWHLLPFAWAWRLLNRAADRGEEFDGLYCGWCYGPGYVASREDRGHG